MVSSLSQVIRTYTSILHVTSLPFTDLLSQITTDINCLIPHLQTLNELSDNCYHSTVHILITTMLSETFFDFCQKFLLINLSSKHSEWSLFLENILKVGNIFQELVKLTWSCLRSASPDLHQAYYSSRVLSLSIWKDLLSFWDQIFNYESSFRQNLSQFVEDEVIQGALIGIIREGNLVEDRQFLMMKHCNLSSNDCEQLYVHWGDDENESLVMFRKTSRDFLRNFCVGTSTTTKRINLPVLHWLFDQTINAMNSIVNMKLDDDYHTAITESLLHSLSALTSGETLQKNWIGLENDMSIPEKSCLLLTVLFQHNEMYSTHLHTTTTTTATPIPSHFLLGFRVGVLLVIDLYSIVTNTSMSPLPGQKVDWSRRIFQYLLDSLIFPEFLSTENLSKDNLFLLSTVQSFRIKQDHIGVVSLLKFMNLLRKHYQQVTDPIILTPYIDMLDIPSDITSQLTHPTCLSAHLFSHFIHHFISFSFKNTPGMTWKSFLLFIEIIVEFCFLLDWYQQVISSLVFVLSCIP